MVPNLLKNNAKMMAEKENLESRNHKIMVFTPPKNSVDAIVKTMADKIVHSSSSATMLCSKFQESLWLEFGSVAVGSTNSKSFNLVNPKKNESVFVAIEKIPREQGITVVFDTPESPLEIPPQGSISGTIYWVPLFDMAVRGIVVIKMDSKATLQIVVHGIAGCGQKVSVPVE